MIRRRSADAGRVGEDGGRDCTRMYLEDDAREGKEGYREEGEGKGATLALGHGELDTGRETIWKRNGRRSRGVWSMLRRSDEDQGAMRAT